MHDDAGRHTLEQVFGGLAIRRLTAGQQKGQRPTAAVGQGVDLRRAPAARAADGLAPLPPLPPPAQRCALTAELSSRRLAGGPPIVASTSNRSLQTPFAAQRTKRLYNVFRSVSLPMSVFKRRRF